tara:strand:+ start:11585 stop:15175 length:3591 start_codon:yes stop_codon:yes gene_type:complete
MQTKYFLIALVILLLQISIRANAQTASFSITPENANISENGGTINLYVVLNTAPSSDVVIDLISSNTDNVTISKNALVFTPANWNIAQPVLATGVNDDFNRDGDSSTILISVNAALSDPIFGALADRSVIIDCLDDDTSINNKIDFNTTDQLTDLFNPDSSPVFTNLPDQGINNTGSINVPLGTSDLWTYKKGFSVSTTERAVYTFSAFFKILGENGRGGLGFTNSPANEPDVTFGAPENGLGMAFHGGGGEFVNNRATTFVAWPSGFLQVGNWYKMIFRITSNPGTDNFDVEFWIYNADANGNIGSLYANNTATFTNTTMAGSDVIYVYFSAAGNRMEKIDDYEFEIGGATSVVEEGHPVVLGYEISNTTSNAMTADGNVTNDGGTAVIEKGIVYGTNPNPTTNSTKINSGNGTGQFSANVSGLEPNTTYFIRAYAINGIGTSYGAEKIVTTLGTPSIKLSKNSVDVDERAGTNTFLVSLGGQPSSNVTLNVLSNNPVEATISPASLNFDPGNWNTPQTITVTGVDDHVDRDDTTTITIAVDDAASDDAFDALADQSVAVTLNDDDSAGFRLSETTLAVGENAGIGNFTVVLDTEPTSDVMVSISSNATPEATVSAPTLTFTSANWDTPQTITVTGVDDDVDRDDTATITVAIDDAGSDDAFETLADQSVAITLNDDDSAGFRLSKTTLAVGENAGTGTFTVVLDAEPTSDVVVNISSGATPEATVSAPTLTFTSANWNTPQTITVTGVDDEMDRDDTATIIVAIDDASSDDAFDELMDQSVHISLVDDDNDTDNDGILDNSDNCPSIPNTDQADNDSDGDGDVCDTDDDNDGTPDTEDAFPLDGNEDTDTDRDGTGDNADTDDDNDGTPDNEDAFPLDGNEDTDTDGDGTGDNADTDDDRPDSDGDGVPDIDDAFPNDPNESIDTDGDGIGDNSDVDVNGDGSNDNGTDTDGDGINDDNDKTDDRPDTDGDGVNNDLDDCPNTPSGEVADVNGCSDSQKDSDFDGVNDVEDQCPESPEDEAVDAQGCSDSQKDDDNDGVNNNLDECPDTSTDEVADANGCSNSQKDTDGDGVQDSLDNCPVVSNPGQEDRDGDGQGDVCDTVELNVSQAFTPNGDGINDTWVISNIENYPNSLVRVFNSWGKEVFSARNYRNTWDGRFKDQGAKLPDAGSYYFQIDFEGDGKVDQDGWLYINSN